MDYVISGGSICDKGKHPSSDKPIRCAIGQAVLHPSVQNSMWVDMAAVSETNIPELDANWDVIDQHIASWSLTPEQLISAIG